MQKHGIDLFERKKKIDGTERAKKGILWFIGAIEPGIRFLLFQTVALSILHAPASVYSAMLGIGIVIVILYSSKI